MVAITVYLSPALTGVVGEMWVGFVVGEEPSWFKVIDTPVSVNGVIGPFGYAAQAPHAPHQLRFPEQTVNGVTYLETRTSEFTATQDRTFNITLTPSVLESMIALIGSAVTGLVLFVLGIS